MPDILNLETGHEIMAWWDKERDLVIIKVRQWKDDGKRGAMIVLPDVLPIVFPGTEYPRFNADWHTDAIDEVQQLYAQLKRFGDGVEVANVVLGKIALITKVVGDLVDRVPEAEPT